MNGRSARTEATDHRARATSLGFGAAVSVVLAVLVLFSPSAAAASAWSPDPVSWSNGVVLCDFAPNAPSVAVSHLGLSDSGMTVSLQAVEELRPDQSVAASADLQGVAWTVANWSTSDAYDLAFSDHAALLGPSGAPPAVGSVDLVAQFILPTYQGSPDGATDAVSVALLVGNWTWQGSGDHLALEFAVSPTYPTDEHLNATSAPGWLVASSSIVSGSELERVGMNASGTAVTSDGRTVSVPATPTVTVAPSSADIAMTFGSGAGAFTSLTFLAHVGVVLPGSIAGIPLSELLAAAAAGTLVSVGVAVVARRIRKKPSTLIFAPPEEGP